MEKNRKKRRSGHLVLAESGNGDVEVGEEKPTRRPAKKIKVEPTTEGEHIEAKSNGPEGPTSRIAKTGRKKKTGAPQKQQSDLMDEPESPGEDGMEAVKVEQLDGTTDLKTKAGVKTEPERVTKTPSKSRRGKPSKALTVRDAEEVVKTAPSASARSAPKRQEATETEDDLEPVTRRAKPGKALKVEYQGEEVRATGSTPAEPEQKTARAPEPDQDQPKATMGKKKKGIAKAVAKQRISKAFSLCPVQSQISAYQNRADRGGVN
jgi:hypothetical protein